VVVDIGLYNYVSQHSTDTFVFQILVWSQSINFFVYVLITVLKFSTNVCHCATLDRMSVSYDIPWPAWNQPSLVMCCYIIMMYGPISPVLQFLNTDTIMLVTVQPPGIYYKGL